MLGLGALGLWRAYSGTLAFYRGQTGKRSDRAPAPARAAPAGERLLVERQLPWVPEEAAAMALAALRSMTRAPEAKLALVANVFIFAMIGVGALLRGAAGIPVAVKPLIASGTVAVTFLGFVGIAAIPMSMLAYRMYRSRYIRSVSMLPDMRCPSCGTIIPATAAKCPVCKVRFTVRKIVKEKP